VYFHSKRTIPKMLQRGLSRVTIDANAMAYCKRIALERTEKNRSAGVVDSRYSNQTAEDLELQGCLGEYAFSLMSGVPHTLEDTRNRNARTDFKHDIVLPNGKTIDIKTARGNPSGLFVSMGKAVRPADYYVLLHYSGAVGQPGAALSFLGVATPAKVFLQETLRQQTTKCGNHPYWVHVVPLAELTKTFTV
jgi:hypothetical protein